MRRIFADTSFLVSYYNEGDSNHNEARGIAQSLEGENILWVISDYIFVEAVSFDKHFQEFGIKLLT